MKLKFECVQCKNKGISNKDEGMILEINEEGIYKVHCSNKHENVVILNHHKYEILFEMGIQALIDGYPREAVSNFAAAIERFHEFSIQVFLRHNHILNIEDTWKHLKNMTERQLGAYLALYVVMLKKPPESLDTKDIEFRNKVIHKGVFPSYKEVKEYSNRMFEYIKVRLVEIGENFPDTLYIINDQYIASQMIPDNTDKLLVSWSEYTIFDSKKPVEKIKELDFEQCFEERKLRKTFLTEV